MRTVVVTLVARRIRLTSHMTGAMRFGYGLVEQLRTPGHELVAARAGADELDGGSDELTDPLDVLAAVLGEIVPAFRRADLLLPAWKLFVQGLGVLVVGDVGHRVVVLGAAKLVAGADLELGLVVEEVGALQGGDADAVEAARVAGRGCVEPSAGPVP